MAAVHLEVLVEPFKENDPGPHVLAVVDKLAAAGLSPDMGPFATTASGDARTISAVLGELTNAAITAGATSLQLRVTIDDER